MAYDGAGNQACKHVAVAPAEVQLRAGFHWHTMLLKSLPQACQRSVGDQVLVVTTYTLSYLRLLLAAANWGEEGYFKLKYGVGKSGMCAIASAASYPIKTHDNPRVPSMCDPFGWQECPYGNTCSCAWPFFFNLFCIR